jgi:hypothetical protein
MQLNPSNLRSRLGAAVCVLLASAAPSIARAEGGTTQLDASLLIYGEQARAKVAEPTMRVTRIYSDGQSISGQLGIDVITGATPSGGLPSGIVTVPPGGGGDLVHTATAASGGGGGTSAPDPGALPLSRFHDTRLALDADWQKPLGLLTSDLSGHFSRERDYQSIGASSKLSLEMFHKLTTIAVGGGFNDDNVFPHGGTRAPLADTTIIISNSWNPKHVRGGLVGLSQILTRRWMIGVNGSRSIEQGYLTEPYKIVSIMDPSTGLLVGQLTENRPSRRVRSDVLSSSVYHFLRDVLYLSHRYYWDDWGVRSHTLDLKYRHELQDSVYIQPHVRYYAQSPADFFRFGLVQGAPIPAFITSDERLGPLKTVTVGAALGFTLPDTPGEWTIRAEYIRQFGSGHPDYVTGVQRDFNLFPPENIGSLVVAYSLAL